MSEGEAWDILCDTDALRCCSCPSCNHYLPHDEAEAARLGVPKYDPDSTCEVRQAIERIVNEARAEAWSVGWADGRLSMEREMGD